MRAIFLILGIVMVGILLVFAVQNASSMTSASFKFFGSNPIVTISMVPIIVGGILGAMAGFFLAMFAMTKQKTDDADNQAW